MQKKKAILTITIGPEIQHIARLTHPLIKAYAEKLEADFIVIDKHSISEIPQYEKFQIYNYFFEQNYDRIIYLDTDIVVRPDCPNLFEIVPEDKIGIFNEGQYKDYTSIIRDACRIYKTDLPKWNRQYYNTGVMVLSRGHRYIFKNKPSEAIEFGGENEYEAPWLNLFIINEGCSIYDIGWKFNRTKLLDPILFQSRLAGYIIHYSNMGPFETRFFIIKDDLLNLQKSAPDYKYPCLVSINIEGNLETNIAAEPVVRYLKEKVYPEDNISLQTSYPFLFKHLNLFEINGPHFYSGKQILLCPAKSNLHNYIDPAFCHPIDLLSIIALKKFLYSLDKTIKIEVPVDRNTAVMNDFILLFIDDPKTCNEILKKVPLDKKIIRVGTPFKDYKISQENVMDWSDYTSIEDIIVLIKKAPVFITDNSTFALIAGAFDNWIVYLIKDKHPEFVLPFRYGRQTYKTKVATINNFPDLTAIL